MEKRISPKVIRTVMDQAASRSRRRTPAAMSRSIRPPMVWSPPLWTETWMVRVSIWTPPVRGPAGAAEAADIAEAAGWAMAGRRRPP